MTTTFWVFHIYTVWTRENSGSLVFSLAMNHFTICFLICEFEQCLMLVAVPFVLFHHELHHFWTVCILCTFFHDAIVLRFFTDLLRLEQISFRGLIINRSTKRRPEKINTLRFEESRQELALCWLIFLLLVTVVSNRKAL